MRRSHQIHYEVIKMIEKIKQNRETLKKLFDQVEATDQKGSPLMVDEALENAIHLISACADAGGKVMFIGNGGSAAIASHMATDFWKNVGVKAVSFNDSVLLTCLSNDEGYSHVFEKSIEMFAQPKDLLVAISSSGKSENIIRGVDAIYEKGGKAITFTGFGADNPLRRKGEINFYVPASHYGHVEIIHHALCHCLVDVMIANKIKIPHKPKLIEKVLSHE